MFLVNRLTSRLQRTACLSSLWHCVKPQTSMHNSSMCSGDLNSCPHVNTMCSYPISHLHSPSSALRKPLLSLKVYTLDFKMQSTQKIWNVQVLRKMTPGRKNPVREVTEGNNNSKTQSYPGMSSNSGIHTMWKFMVFEMEKECKKEESKRTHFRVMSEVSSPCFW